MKNVLDNSNVAHAWANKLQDKARNAHNNFYFEGDTVYSYGSHFPIAKHVTNSKGIEFVLFTTRCYSMTTTQHKTVVRQAINHKQIIFCLWPTNRAKDNFNDWQTQAEKIAANLETAKKAEKYLSELGQLKYTIEKYSEFTEYPIPQSLNLVLSIGSKEEFFQFENKKKELEEIAAKKAKEELKKRHKKALNEWLKGKASRLYVRDGLDYLRVNGDKIETSQGIDLTIPYGITVYNKLKEDTLKVGDKVLQFDVNKINGVVSIGCHTFKKSYLLNFGKQLAEISK